MTVAVTRDALRFREARDGGGGARICSARPPPERSPRLHGRSPWRRFLADPSCAMRAHGHRSGASTGSPPLRGMRMHHAHSRCAWRRARPWRMARDEPRIARSQQHRDALERHRVRARGDGARSLLYRDLADLAAERWRESRRGNLGSSRGPPPLRALEGDGLGRARAGAPAHGAARGPWRREALAFVRERRALARVERSARRFTRSYGEDALDATALLSREWASCPPKTSDGARPWPRFTSGSRAVGWSTSISRPTALRSARQRSRCARTGSPRRPRARR